jgi:lipopolysaccharide/colanic/teichoic acid biosynthesis glycosyltransferase
MLKRTLDIIVSSLVLLVLSPVLLAVVAILKLTGEHEAFYFQERVGFQGKIIKLTKFVTMVKNAPNMGTGDVTVANDPRVLPVGRFLRKTKLNEFPQFWDVLVGKLSLVGWRPLTPKGFADYPEELKPIIVKVKPGITGIGSLVFRDEEAIIGKAAELGRDVLTCYRDDILPFKGALEVWYVSNANFWTDLKLLAGTAIAVIRPKWTGYRSWFKELPEPVSELVRKSLGY